MQLRNTLAITRDFSQDLGLLRLSSFYSKKNLPEGEKVQKLARLALFFFTGISLLNAFIDFLPHKIKLLTSTPLLICAISLVLSQLLNALIKIWDYLLTFFPVNNRISKKERLTPTRAKRSLLEEFNAVDKKN